jgi:GTP-binding protein YchF
VRTGIIGLPQVGKTSLFKILTKARLDAHAMHSRDAHVGVARVPDERLDRLSAMYHPKKTTHATVEYVDVAAIGQEALQEQAYSDRLREVDSLIHVLRAFEDPAIPHVGELDPRKDALDVEADLMVSDMVQIDKRMERLEKDLKRSRTADLVREHELLTMCKAQLEAERPIRESELSADDRKRLRGFAFLSQKPILYVVNVGEGESAELGKALEAAVARFGLAELASRPNAGATAICGKVEAELADMSDEEAAEFLESYGLTESGLARLIRKTYELLGLVSFLTVGEDECRAWTVPRGVRAQEAAGVIHTDLAKHFIRAETIRWDELLAAGSEANARSKGTLRLEGKDYIVQDGDVMNIRHSG